LELQTIINNNIGVAYRRMGDNASALSYHLKSLEFAQQANNERNISYALNCLGNLYYLTDEYDKSLIHFRQGYLLDVKNNNLR
jgi:tetratricopeptide (TPR) repeat protein